MNYFYGSAADQSVEEVKKGSSRSRPERSISKTNDQTERTEALQKGMGLICNFLSACNFLIFLSFKSVFMLKYIVYYFFDR